MIISVSRRTDIPAFYSDWFINRINEGYVLTSNPFNKNLVHRVSLRKEDVTCFVFWTKNPKNLMKHLDELKDYKYYFQFTLTSYQRDIEDKVPSKNEIVNTFIELSNKIGKEKVIWRYDPILLNDKYTKEYHYQCFEELCKRLCDYTEKCIISFIDQYSKTKQNINELKLHDISNQDIEEIAATLSKIAYKYNLSIETCSESVDLKKFNIIPSKCIDDKLIGRITNKEINSKKDKYQRKECGCINSIDIGLYNTCLHNCLYCYANYSDVIMNKNIILHNKNSPILIGDITDDMKIYERKKE